LDVLKLLMLCPLVFVEAANGFALDATVRKVADM
jgi:hypothetical protein